ncbi:MAG TPA: penicillin-binding protein [Candidatus Ventrousia excrementavium]|uniref:Penicillin-binding protein n=1 Tax=Candidatus Ventrousia excrementavium TaxID=2840961 RepID=A0A9D1ITP0_9CLOT|nr:penicillin-binding protein [Candidatus Ventrousia excrementavium]
MKEKKSLTRTIALCACMLAIAGVLIFRMAQLQLVHGEEYAEASQRKTLRTYDENASRGEITDRNGTALVSNSVGFALVIDYYTWDRDNQNDVILRLTDIMKEAGASYNDTLPLSSTEPFYYTYSSKDSDDGAYLYSFIADQDEWPADPAPAELIDLLCEKYGVDDSLTAAQKRTIVGVRFEMERRDFSSYTPFTFASDVDIETVSLVSERSRELPGVNIEVEDVREYETDYAAHVLGYMGLLDADEYAELKDDGYAYNDSIGKTGMEKALESYLRGIDGERSVETNIDGVILSEFISKEPEPGDNCVLTIDLDLQKAAEDALEQTILDLRASGRELRGADAEGGAVVVMDVNTGEVLALASYPTYNLSTFRQDITELNQDPGRPMYNRAVQGAYPPGSTFKMVTAVAGLEEGIITPETRIRDQGRYMYYAPDYTPACWIYNDTGGTHGNINVSQAIQYSCNYFFYEVSRLLGIDKLNEYAKQFGLGQPTGLELGEAKTNLAGPESREANGGPRWELGETIQAGIGQSEQLFSPVQICSYIATIANGGTRYRPHLLKEVWNYSYTEQLEVIEPEVVDTVQMSEETQQAIFEGMLGVTTEDGTASSRFRNYPIEVAGKTGSAQTVTGTRSAHGVFVSFAPYDDPEIAICVVGEYAGSGGNMAPVAIAVYDEYFGLNQDEPEETYEDTTNTLQGAGTGGSTVIAAEE